MENITNKHNTKDNSEIRAMLKNTVKALKGNCTGS